jgi:hypothetical protein
MRQVVLQGAPQPTRVDGGKNIRKADMCLPPRLRRMAPVLKRRLEREGEASEVCVDCARAARGGDNTQAMIQVFALALALRQLNACSRQGGIGVKHESGMSSGVGVGQGRGRSPSLANRAQKLRSGRRAGSARGGVHRSVNRTRTGSRVGEHREQSRRR